MKPSPSASSLPESTLPSRPSAFGDLKLSAASLRALERAGFEQPTPIQARAIPPALAGRDVIGTAATGTGKTVAFLLPVIERLASPASEKPVSPGRERLASPGHGKLASPVSRARRGTRALVLAPTRELALQIGEELARFGHARQVNGVVVIGGVGMGAQTAALKEGRDVVIATPGRLVDHLQQGHADFGGLEILVLDEADRMLDMGFKPQLDRILARLPKVRQTLLFSATTGGEVADFARAHLRDPVAVEVARSGTTAARADQQVFLAAQQEKLALLLALLERDEVSTLVFTRTKRRADRVAKGVGRAGHKVARIHADRSQAQRRMALDGFKDGTYRVLVATDIAARGIDVADIGHVVNFDLPHVPEDYVHRVGRTARAAASGRASTFTSPEEQDLLLAIERLTRASLPRAEVPREHATFQAELQRTAADGPQGGLGAERARRPPPHHTRRPSATRPPHGSEGARRPGSGSAARAPGAPKNGAAIHPEARKPILVGSWKPRRGRR